MPGYELHRPNVNKYRKKNNMYFDIDFFYECLVVFGFVFFFFFVVVVFVFFFFLFFCTLICDFAVDIIQNEQIKIDELSPLNRHHRLVTLVINVINEENELSHDKTNKMTCAPCEDSDSLAIRPQSD